MPHTPVLLLVVSYGCGRLARMWLLPLPIEPYLPEIVRTIESNTLTLLEAEPGAGKTTRVPAALLRAGRQHIFALEPRRIAARLAARRVASELGTDLGGEVGYQVRYERVGNAGTKLWFVTEGVLAQRLLGRERLPADSVVLLDEFHERHTETDLTLALLREAMRTREDLRIVLMSATLGGARLAEQLGGAIPVMHVPGRVFPVRMEYTPSNSDSLARQVAQALERVAGATRGHTLVFLPGSAEIRQALEAARPLSRAGYRLLPLHGDLSVEEQDAAIAASSDRKVIFATNLAESSITIEGVTVVVDSGLARIASYSPWTGFSRLQVGRVSQSSCVQRAGRAGRTEAGLAIRLYPEEDFRRRPEFLESEIVRADVTRLVLQVAHSGRRLEELPWLEAPKPEAVEHAAVLLKRLGALDARGDITPMGRAMAEAPVHPRLAALVWHAKENGAVEQGIAVAAQLDEGRFRMPPQARSVFTSDVEAMLEKRLSFGAAETAKRLQRSARERVAAAREEGGLERAILLAFSDRVAKRSGENVLFAAGGSAQLDRESCTRSEFLVTVEVEERGGQAPLVRLASPINPDWLLEHFPQEVEAGEELRWNRHDARVEQVQFLRFGAITLDETVARPQPTAEAAELVAKMTRASGWNPAESSEEVRAYLQRLEFAAEHWPALGDATLMLERAVAKTAYGKASSAELRAAAADGELLAYLQAVADQRLLDDVAPAHFQFPGGRRSRISYQPGQPPSLASRLQDFFGLRESPTVAGGKVPLTLKLLAPNGRPVQVTTDLKSFWVNLYPQLRRELSRRYPRHSWPESP